MFTVAANSSSSPTPHQRCSCILTNYRLISALSHLVAPVVFNRSTCSVFRVHVCNHTCSVYVRSDFLANVNSLTFTLAMLSLLRLSVYLSPVCLSSVTFVRPTQPVEIFGNISTAFGTLAIRWHPQKISRRSSQGNPSAGGVKHKRVVKYSDFGPIEGYISETVQDRK